MKSIQKPHGIRTLPMRAALAAVAGAAFCLFTSCASAPPQISQNPEIRYFERAVEAESKGLHHAAISHYTQFLDIYAHHPSYAVPAYNNRGTVYWAMGRHEEALADFTLAAKLDPNVAQTFINRGNVYEDLDQIERAIADYTHAIDLDSENGLAYSNRGLAWSRLKRFDQALPDLDKAIELGHAGMDKSLMKRALIRFGTRDYTGAVQDLTRVIKLIPNYAEAYFFRGQAHQQLNEMEKAQKDLNMAVELRRNEGEAAAP